MLTKKDFQQAIVDSIVAYPAVAPLYQAGDPRILQSLDAMATMLAMFSSQIETAMAEPFEKVRDATVLADAAMRGVIRKASPGRVRITVNNGNNAAFTVDTGRTIIDSAGLSYIIETSVVVAANSAGTFDAVQVKRETVNHTVSGSTPFYAIEIPESIDDTYLSGIAVSDVGGEYEYRERYVNTWPDERVFHVEADDRQRIYVRFGQTDIVGVQPADGQVITLTISRTAGEISTASGSPFSFEYLQSPNESAVEMALDSLLFKGQEPLNITDLREISKYPSVYDHSAVFLGEFDFLVRRNFPGLLFLSVWNESVEERVRGASVDNINTLFVACFYETEQILIETIAPLSPVMITELTAIQQSILNTIRNADDSYKVKFFTPIKSKIEIEIAATVSSSFVVSNVRSQIIEAILAEFGENAASSKRGSNSPLYQQIYALLKEKIPALSAGRADMTVNITEPSGGIRPELWRYVSQDSLIVIIQTANVILPSWGA